MIPLLRYAYAVTRGGTIGVLVVTIVGSISTVLLTYLVGRVVGAASDLTTGGDFAGFGWLLAAMGVVFVVNSAMPVLRMAGAIRLEVRLTRAVAKQIADPLLTPRRVAHLDDPEVQDAYARTRDEAQTPVQFGPTTAIFLLAGRIGLIGSALLVGTLLAWWLPLILIASIAYAEIYFRRIIDREIDVWRGRTEGQRKASYFFDLGMLHGPKEVRIFGLSRWMTQRYADLWREALAPVWRRRWRGAFVSVAALSLHVAIFSAAVAFALRAAYQGDISLAAVTTVLPSIMVMATGFNPGSSAQVRRAAQTLKSMEELPKTIEERHPEPEGRSADVSRAPRHEIRFEGVSFRYPGQDRDVLHDLDLTIKANEALALVGVNGAGKSTLVKLLAGGYRPTTGRITVDGVDLTTLDAESLSIWQRRIAAIVQDFLRFPLSAEDNVIFGPMEGERDRASLLRAANQAGIEEIIERLPERWETVLDKAFEDGTDLSGGEWQRVALARALYAVNAGASVLVLDEPAAALDVRAETQLVEHYLELTSGVTSLIISHRFSVVRDADRICVLDDGRIVESGTHAELIAKQGRYATMFTLQAKRYIADETAEVAGATGDPANA